MTGLPSAGEERQYVPAWVASQIRLRSHSTKVPSDVPRHQVLYSSMLPSRAGTYHATSFTSVGSDKSWMRAPATSQAHVKSSGRAVPGATQDWQLCVPKRPRARQKSAYGASFGGIGRGKNPMILGLLGLLMSRI